MTSPSAQAPGPARDAEGYLIEPAAWNEGIARRLANELGIELNDDHWDVIRHMRALWEERQIAPDARHIIKHRRTEVTQRTGFNEAGYYFVPQESDERTLMFKRTEN